jgi:hypothetical protein
LSQAVFARYLNLTIGYVSQLERGAKRSSGAALALLNLIRRKGIEAIIRNSLENLRERIQYLTTSTSGKARVNNALLTLSPRCGA